MVGVSARPLSVSAGDVHVAKGQSVAPSLFFVEPDLGFVHHRLGDVAMARVFKGEGWVEFGAEPFLFLATI